MSPKRSAGSVIIAGSLGMAITMTLHPSGGSAAGIVQEASFIMATHALVIVSLSALVLGFIQWARTVESGRFSADAGLILFGLAAVSGFWAAIVNGFVVPMLAKRVLTASADKHASFNSLFLYSQVLNTALTQVVIAGACASVLIWSVGLIRTERQRALLGTAGIAFSTLGLTMLMSGRIRNDVHHVGLFAVGLSLWTAAFGVLLYRSPAQHAAP